MKMELSSGEQKEKCENFMYLSVLNNSCKISRYDIWLKAYIYKKT